MEQLMQWRHCERCRECCRWVDPERGKVLFTREEMGAVQEIGGELPTFLSYHGSPQVFYPQLRYSPSPLGDYICPFLNESTSRCRIYERRPFDCRAWPFLYAWGEVAEAVQIACFKFSWCPVLRESSAEAFAAYSQKMVEWMGSDMMLEWLQRYPELIWADKAEVIFPVEDLTERIRQILAKHPR